MPQILNFTGYNSLVKRLRNDKGDRLEVDLSNNEYDEYIPLNNPHLDGLIHFIAIIPDREEKEVTARMVLEGAIATYCKKFGSSRERLKKFWIARGIIQGSTTELPDENLRELADQLWTSIKFESEPFDLPQEE